MLLKSTNKLFTRSFIRLFSVINRDIIKINILEKKLKENRDSQINTIVIGIPIICCCWPLIIFSTFYYLDISDQNRQINKRIFALQLNENVKDLSIKDLL